MSISLTSYFHMINNSWRNKNGERLSECLSCRHGHALNSRLYVDNPEADCADFLDSPVDDIVGAHLRCIKELSRRSYKTAFDYQLMVTSGVTKVLQSLADENWLLPVVKTAFLDLRLIALKLLNVPGVGTKALETAAETLMSCFRICAADNRASERDSKRMGMMSLINQLFKIYFRINKLHLMKPLSRAIEQSPYKDRFPLGQRITYKYFIGRKAMFYSDYATANEYLTFAFVHCHKQSKKNKRLILLNLVPVKMLLGYMPTKAVLEKYDLLQLWEVVLAVKKGCISELSNVMQQHQAFFIKSGIYLIIEKLKIITYRNLFKKVWFLSDKTHQLPIHSLLVALQMMEGEGVELEEAHCILANLIHEGKVKGYISLQHQKLVLSKTDPFPRLSTVSS
ncbi:PCI domain-containing protein 2 [Macrosteles quadrilineatus]|uniref:PCI domain-containing protein 2 n=1 Tax=Macrosteles quadrilineatus TaxID=74068 RepID=UPI0023E11E2F|nr:PCI domain-containing protein 2 [Macrosteles quadrilineatus]